MAACRPITPEIQEAEARGLGVQGQPEQLCETHLKLKKNQNSWKCSSVVEHWPTSHLAGQTQTNKTQNKTKQKPQSPTSWRVQEPH